MLPHGLFSGKLPGQVELDPSPKRGSLLFLAWSDVGPVILAGGLA